MSKHRKLVNEYYCRDGSKVCFYFDFDDSMFIVDYIDFTTTKLTSYNNRLKSFFSQAALTATNFMRKYGLKYDEIAINVSYSEEKGYEYKIECFEYRENKNIDFIISNNSVIVKSSIDEGKYIERDLSKYPEEVIEKIKYLKKYFLSNSSEIEYIEQIIKGKTTELGDPIM